MLLEGLELRMDVEKRSRHAFEVSKKKLLKTLEIEIKRLDTELKESSSTLNSYQKLIVDSVLYVADRDNLSTSNFTGSHNARIRYIHTLIDQMKSSDGNKPDYDKFASTIDMSNSHHQDEVQSINKDIKSCTDTMMTALGLYTESLNQKIAVIQTQQRLLERVYREVNKAEYGTYIPSLVKYITPLQYASQTSSNNEQSVTTVKSRSATLSKK